MSIVWVASLASSLSQTPVVVGGEDLQSPRQPQLAMSSDGVVHLAFGDGNRIFYAWSKAEAVMRFSKPVKVADIPNLSLGKRRGPRIAAAGGTIVVSAIGGEQEKRRDGDLFAWRSIDSGKTWKGPARVNDVSAAAREGLHSMTGGTDGTFACAWLDLRTKRMTLHVSTSSDGTTWAPNVLAYQSPTGAICECCHPTLIFDEKNVLHLFWRNSVDGFRDMYRSVSSDGGKTFSKAIKIGSGAWKLNACPMDGGSIAVRGEKVDTAWRREHIVYATFGKDDQEVKLGDGEQPCIAALEGGSIVAWLKRRPGDLLLQREKDSQPSILAKDASDPVLVSSPDGARAILAWEGADHGRPAIFAQIVDGRPKK